MVITTREALNAGVGVIQLDLGKRVLAPLLKVASFVVVVIQEAQLVYWYLFGYDGIKGQLGRFSI